MKTNIIDRVIAAVAPAAGAQRLKARMQAELLAGIPGPSAMIDDRNSHPASGAGLGGSMRRMWGSAGRDARSDVLVSLTYDRANSRDLARTSPIAVGAINTNIDRVVGTGLALSAAPNLRILGWSAKQGAKWKAEVQDEYSLWADSTMCDITETHNFYELQALVLRSSLESGDTFTLMPDGERSRMRPYALRLQILEADRVGNPDNGADSADVAAGIRFAAKGGAPLAAHIYSAHPGSVAPTVAGGAYKGEWQAFVGKSGRRQLLHHFRKLRPDQPRGLPYLAPIIESLKQITRYTEAEIMAAVISAYFTVFIETPTGNGSPIFTGDAPGAASGAIGDEIGLAPGAVVGLAPGEKVQLADPSRPNPNFDPFITAILKQCGMALGMPPELLVKQYASSFSASKAALLDAWAYFRGVRTWLARSFCQPVYETWLAEAVALGRISAPGFFTDPMMRWAYTRAMWPGDSMGSIEPKREVEAYIAAINARLMTRERAEWEMFGTDFNDTFETKESEERRLKGADMLPTPLAGAAAPAKPAAKPPADPPEDQLPNDDDDDEETQP